MTQPSRLHISTITLIASSLLCSATTYAAGFALKEVSSSLMGAAFSSASTSKENISTMAYNPAAIGMFDGLNVYATGAYLEGHGGLKHIVAKPGGQLSGINTETRDFEENTGGDAFIPASFVSTNLTNKRFHFGIGVTAPFGLSTSYRESYPGRFHGTHSELRSVHINPVLAYTVNEKWIFAGGLQVISTRLKLTNNVFVAPGLQTGYAEIQGTGWGAGASLGVIYKPSYKTTVGLGYQSPIKIRARGTNQVISNPPSGASIAGLSGRAISDVTLPEKVNLGINYTLTPHWDLSADVQWTGWSRFKELKIITRVADGVPAASIAAGSSITSIIDEDWKDAFYYSLGAHYNLAHWKLRLGVGYDESPIPNNTRTPRLPGNDRWLAGLGATYKVNKSLSFDAGYLHVFIRDGRINLGDSGNNRNRGTMTATNDARVDIIAVGASAKF